jgi:hypothetical protein
MFSVGKWYVSSLERWMVISVGSDRSKASRYWLTGDQHRTELCQTEKINTSAEIAVRLCCRYFQSPFYPAQIQQRGKFSITEMCGSSHVWYAAMIIRPVVGIDRQWTSPSAALTRIFRRVPFFLFANRRAWENKHTTCTHQDTLEWINLYVSKQVLHEKKTRNSLSFIRIALSYHEK